MNFKEDCRKRTEKIEEILRKYLPDQTGHQQIIEEAMEYSLMAGGKRLRPIMMIIEEDGRRLMSYTEKIWEF